MVAAGGWKAADELEMGGGDWKVASDLGFHRQRLHPRRTARWRLGGGGWTGGWVAAWREDVWELGNLVLDPVGGWGLELERGWIITQVPL